MTRRAIGYVAAIGALAGLAGGLAEVIWICTYAAVTNSDAGLVARAVTDTFRFGNQHVSPIVSGVGIHLGLAAILGITVAIAIRPILGFLHGIDLYGSITAALAVVWAVNFFVVLPFVNPRFVYIVPYEVSLLSKLLFGVAAAGLFQLAQLARPNLFHA